MRKPPPQSETMLHDASPVAERTRSKRRAIKLHEPDACNVIQAGDWQQDSSPRDYDKPTIAIKSSCLHGPQPRASAPDLTLGESTLGNDLSGLWNLLPNEIVENILNLCSCPQLGMLETTCGFFRKSGAVDKIAKQRLKAIPRARGLKPNRKENEKNLPLLHFVNSQSAAAAQATAVSCGSHHTAALLIPSEVEAATSEFSRDCKHALYTFGRGFHGQLGTGTFNNKCSPTVTTLGFRQCQDNPDFEEETMPAVVACGTSHSTSISRRGELFTWGLGCHGELGLGQWTPLEVPRPKQCFAQTRIVSIAAGASHTLAIAETGSLWSCGRGKQGQLGLGNLQDSTRLSRVGNLEGVRIVSAAAGVTHSMALAADGSLYTWGDGRYGQLGHSQLQHLAGMLPNQVVVIPAPQKIQKLDPGPLAPESRVTAIAAGAYHSMALTVGGALLAFGRNDQGALGTGDTVDKWKPAKIDLNGQDPSPGRCKRAVQVACGSAHTIVLISNGGTLEVRTTGCNTWGQLGQGDRKERYKLGLTMVKIPGVVAVQSGCEHSTAITSSGQLFVWGRGDSGQLGLGDERCKWKPTLLKEFKVVHPDKTLRRNKRSTPVMRSVEPEVKRQRLGDVWHFQ